MNDDVNKNQNQIKNLYYSDICKGVKHSFLYDDIATSSHEGSNKTDPYKKCCKHVLHIYLYNK